MWVKLVIYKDYTEMHGQQKKKLNNIYDLCTRLARKGQSLRY